MSLTPILLNKYAFKDVLKIEIEKIIDSLDFSDIYDKGFGLYVGTSGNCLVLSELYKVFKDDKYIDLIIKNLQNGINHIENNPYPSYLFSNGIAGWGWIINYLQQNRITEVNAEEIVGELDEAIKLRLQHYLVIPNYDQLNGAIGIARYFMSRKIFEPVEMIIEFLDHNKIEDELEIKWSRLHSDGERHSIFDFGLAHGIPGIIYFLGKCIKNNIHPEKCLKYVKGAVRFIINNVQDFDTIGSFFPNSIAEKNYVSANNVPEKSRLSWCYGDLGIWYTLYKSSFIIDDKALNTESIEALLKLSIISPIQVDLPDAGFCHGTSGIAYLFHKLFEETKIKEFEDASLRWIGATLAHGNNDDDSGYRFLIKKHQSHEASLLPCANLLNGLNGVLLVYLSFIYPDSHWDEAFMLD